MQFTILNVKGEAMKILDVQQRLASIGCRPGPLDGIWGRQTAAALRAFQAANGLEADGILGPITLSALFPDFAPSEGFLDPSLVWFKEATRLLGTKENPGHGSNPEILDWASDIGIPYKGDDIPWCGLFVSHCITSTLDREPTPSSLLMAQAWKTFGIKTKPTLGAVMVFWRGKPNGTLGHVGFYAGEEDGAYRILGGNQSDSVSLVWISKSRLLDARWPSTVPPKPPVQIIVGRDEGLSWMEA